jgi:hypothetical protein
MVREKQEKRKGKRNKVCSSPEKDLGVEINGDGWRSDKEAAGQCRPVHGWPFETIKKIFFSFHRATPGCIFSTTLNILIQVLVPHDV